MTLPVRVIFGLALSVAAIAAVAGGFLLVGSPQEARLERLDSRRVADLQQIQRAVNAYWTRTKGLPETIDLATRDVYPREPLRDPVSQSPYEYRAIDSSNYELCATFDRAASETGYSNGLFWSHPAGRRCFTLAAADLNRPPAR